jgi:hypothetical protein
VYASKFSVPKRGSSTQDYEDASWVGPDGNGDGEIKQGTLRVVVSDGASTSMLASRWSRRLVEVFGTAEGVTRSRTAFVAAYRAAVRIWDQEILKYIAEREERGVPIQWYEEPGLAKGAHATILITEFRDGRRGTPARWRAAAIGDSCLFQVRNETLYACFPISDADEFSYQPPLLPSRAPEEDLVRRNIIVGSRDWQPGDSFYMATDALAAWFIRTSKAGGKPWEPLRDLDTDTDLDFATLVDRHRDQGEMQNDDTTLVRIDMW